MTGSNNGGSIYLGIGGTNPTAAIESSWGGTTWPQLGIGVVRDSLTANILMDYGSNTQIRRGTTTTMYLSGAGNVGIGTTAPIAPLSFATALGEKLTLWGTDTTQNYGFGIQSNLLQIHTDISSSDIVFGFGSSTSFTERMRIKGNGNVGIGMTAPSSTLQVAGSMRLGSTALGVDENGGYAISSGGQLTIAANDGNSGDGSWTNLNLSAGVGSSAISGSNPSINFSTVGAQRMTITSAGNVGIGTTAPGQKLSVAGTIESTSGGIKFPDGSTQATASPIKAWVNFNAATQTINASYNVSSITYVSTGQYQINFTNPMVSSGYAVTGSCQTDTLTTYYNDSNECIFSIAKGIGSPLTTTFARVTARNSCCASYANASNVSVTIIGN